MKKTLLILFAAAILVSVCSCSLKSRKNPGPMPPQGVPTREEAPEIYGNIPGNIVNGGIPSLTVAGTDFEATTETTTEYKTESTETIESIEFGLGNFVLEDVIAPWTEKDIDTAMSMSIFSDPYSGYNRRFVDLDNDGISELIMTWRYYFGLLFIFQKADNEITQIPFISDYDTTTLHSVFGIPPVYEEDYNRYFDSSNNKFVIGKALNGNYYISGYSHSPNKDTCFIKQILYENGEANVKTIYRWGNFRRYYSNETDDYSYVWAYIEYLNGEQAELSENETGIYIDRLDHAEYIEVRSEEIEEFLIQIYGDEYKELYP
jgi:hypothetical protein